jgi:hypothetical protein
MFHHLKPSLKLKTGIPPAPGQPRKMPSIERIVELSALQFAQLVLLPIAESVNLLKASKIPYKVVFYFQHKNNLIILLFSSLRRLTKRKKIPDAGPWWRWNLMTCAWILNGM